MSLLQEISIITVNYLLNLRVIVKGAPDGFIKSTLGIRLVLLTDYLFFYHKQTVAVINKHLTYILLICIAYQWRIQDFPNGGALFCRKWGGAHPVFR